MEREIIITSDGSTTIHLPSWNEQYHSKHGAIQEAYHVFLHSGFFKIDRSSISILEIGFGTGLNAFITFLESRKRNKKVKYVGVEAYPISSDEVQKLNYVSELNAKANQTIFEVMHQTPWDEEYELSKDFHLFKRKQFFQEINDVAAFDLIYFDAFGAQNQPELWTEEIFEKMFQAIRPDGILVTYCAKGSVRRAMQSVGFMVERLPGPPGKREMLRATKI